MNDIIGSITQLIPNNMDEFINRTSFARKMELSNKLEDEILSSNLDNELKSILIKIVRLARV